MHHNVAEVERYLGIKSSWNRAPHWPVGPESLAQCLSRRGPLLNLEQ